MKNTNKSQKLLILSGPPASGKSTYAMKLCESDTSWIRVNMDSLRRSVGKYWVPSREPFITKLSEYVLEEALLSGYNVISDNVNLNPKTLKKLIKMAEKYGVEVETKSFYIPYKEACERDAQREHPITDSVIYTFYQRYFPDKLKEELDL